MPTIDTVSAYLETFSGSREIQLSIIDQAPRCTEIERRDLDQIEVPFFINEYWTSRQRQTSSIQEISYRACFKPQLPRFFIELLTVPGQTVFDPFAGRGTTILEAALMNRRVIANDINPLSRILTEPRLDPPGPGEVEKRLHEIPLAGSKASYPDLSMFYHPRTEAELLSLRSYLSFKQDSGTEDSIDRWIRMVATNRLTGHSRGFFSVYTMPPNQAVSARQQQKINLKRDQKPEYRNVKELITRKSNQLMRNLTAAQIARLKDASESAVFLTKEAANTSDIKAETINLTVTSPPFLDIVQYSADNWLRCWFNQIAADEIDKKITMARSLKEWAGTMRAVFEELYRITAPGGWVAFEVGEVRKGTINLEDTVVSLGLQAGFRCAGVVVNRQEFTKTSNIWGVQNNRAGTNSNRIVLLTRPG